MKSLISKVNTHFERSFHYQAQSLFQAPGRVNLIGEHTDYNDGFVLPCAINFYNLVAASPRTDRQIRVLAVDYDDQVDSFYLDSAIEPHSNYLWANYVRGVVKLIRQRFPNISGIDLAICGNVPQGAGLSSSASLEVVIAQAFNRLFDLDLSPSDLALIGQQAENQFVGCQCGIMDQMISASAQRHHAMLLDCRSLTYRAVKIPAQLSILIINSNVKRGLVDSEYNTRRLQCEQAASLLGITALRDISLINFEQCSKQLPDLIAQRARHVISENERTLCTEQALNQGNISLLSQLMTQSHSSMRDDFEITVPEIDFLVDLVANFIGDSGGVRMTGGGFGGCVVALIPHDQVDAIIALVNQHYGAVSDVAADFYCCHPVAGTSELQPHE